VPNRARTEEIYLQNVCFVEHAVEGKWRLQVQVQEMQQIESVWGASGVGGAGTTAAGEVKKAVKGV